MKKRFKQLPDGKYAVRLPTEERVLLKILPNQLLDSLNTLSAALSGKTEEEYTGDSTPEYGPLEEDPIAYQEGFYTIDDFEIPEAIKRLLPKAYLLDEAAQNDFSTLTSVNLLKEHIDNLNLLMSSISNQYLTVDELHRWMMALNNLRLVIGTVIGVTENSSMPDFDDPIVPQWIAYGYLTELVEDIVSVLFNELPDVAEDDDPFLPEDPWGEPPGGMRWDGTTKPEGPFLQN
ncbi:MAG: DUF2017 domain-containing protein [Firmicutes bacterium]|jgi:hypothetical protein|nr:DUF2017 domain-containing protein [Bacillota bacterium]